MIWYKKKQTTQEGGENEENCEEIKQDTKMKENDARKRNGKGRTHDGKENENKERNRKEKNETKIEKRKGKRIAKEDTGQCHDFEWCLVN